MKAKEYEKLVDEASKKHIAILGTGIGALNGNELLEIFYKDGTTQPIFIEVGLGDKYISKSFEYVIKSIKVSPLESVERIIDTIISKKIGDKNAII